MWTQATSCPLCPCRYTLAMPTAAAPLLLLLLQEFYETTLVALEKARNDRLWFKTQLKLVGLWFKAKEYSRMHKILKELHRCVCVCGGGGVDGCVCVSVCVGKHMAYILACMQGTGAILGVCVGGVPPALPRLLLLSLSFVLSLPPLLSPSLAHSLLPSLACPPPHTHTLYNPPTILQVLPDC